MCHDCPSAQGANSLRASKDEWKNAAIMDVALSFFFQKEKCLPFRRLFTRLEWQLRRGGLKGSLRRAQGPKKSPAYIGTNMSELALNICYFCRLLLSFSALSGNVYFPSTYRCKRYFAFLIFVTSLWKYNDWFGQLWLYKSLVFAFLVT